MWLERFNIVVGSLYHTDLPASIHIFIPTRWDFVFLFGSMGLFAFLYLLFGRFFPLLALAEMRKDKEEVE
jgi:molybdopterin-containing oxidoreductase family membrane subunit